MLKRLRIRFVCINMAIVVAMLCVIFGLVIRFTSRNLEVQSIQMMQSIASNPARSSMLKEMPDEIRLPYFTLEIGKRGEVIATGGGYYDLTDEEFLRELMGAAFAAREQTGILEGYGLRFCRVVTPVSQRLVFVDISSEQATMDQLIRTCVFIGILSFFAFLIISLFLARWAVRPVDRAWTQQRQFVADASHELKTPLTVIMTNAELLQNPDYDEASRAQFTGSILTMSQQMRGLVEGLLELARVDNGTAKMAFSDLDFSQLVSDSLLPFEPLYFEAGHALDCRIEDGIHLKGSASHLRQVVDILLDNAMKYTLPCSTVSVPLNKHGAYCLLTVADPGASISPEDLKNIFKRFYRIDKARSMNHSYGLGLSIAESIVTEHRGKIWAESSGGTNTFFVQLPL